MVCSVAHIHYSGTVGAREFMFLLVIVSKLSKKQKKLASSGVCDSGEVAGCRKT